MGCATSGAGPKVPLELSGAPYVPHNFRFLPRISEASTPSHPEHAGRASAGPSSSRRRRDLPAASRPPAPRCGPAQPSCPTPSARRRTRANRKRGLRKRPWAGRRYAEKAAGGRAAGSRGRVRHFPFPQIPQRSQEVQGGGGPHRWAAGARDAAARDQGRGQRGAPASRAALRRVPVPGARGREPVSPETRWAWPIPLPSRWPPPLPLAALPRGALHFYFDFGLQLQVFPETRRNFA